MRITFHGAARCVTGSKHLLELNSGTKILLDCGMFQGNPKESDALNRHFGFSPMQINYVLLSHAHIDHCGLLPRLVAEGFTGKIYCTPATYDLAKILLLDSAKIHENDVLYLNKKLTEEGKPLVEALYTTDDVYRALFYFTMVPWGQTVKLETGVEFTFTDVGHIIGSAAINLSITENGQQKRIMFSGDVGRYDDEILNAPQPFPEADVVVLESTYGDSLHEDTNMSDRRLLEIITETCVKKKGKLIIPAFSVGRTQELVYALNRLEISKALPDIDFYVDSPLSTLATEVMKQHSECYNQRILQYMQRDPEPFNFKRLHYITDVVDSIALNSIEGPCVIISASGMADAGRVKHHIRHNIGSSRNTILIVGYCEPRSLGGKLMNGDTEITIYGRPYSVNAKVEVMRTLSAHADYQDLIRFVTVNPVTNVKRLFLVHGEYEVQQNFRDKLHNKGFENITIPEMHESFEI
jgi:metallo-beta-lactamase family protein